MLNKMKNLKPNDSFLMEKDLPGYIKNEPEPFKDRIEEFKNDFLFKVENEVEFLKDKSIILDSNITIQEINGESGK